MRGILVASHRSVTVLESSERFRTGKSKRKILVVDDEMINREMLGAMLQEKYEVLFARDGAEALEAIRRNADDLSLVLLDILMPVMSGIEVLKTVKEDAELARVPIIVVTAERETEVESLRLGAIDFIPKPYPSLDVIEARVKRTIELSEDRDIIQSTERDELTGLFNREYFYRYAEQYDQFHKDVQMDAILVDVNHFRMINERYGRAYGDEVLRRIAEQVLGLVKESDGIVARGEADTFMAYCPHRDDYQSIMDNASVQLVDDGSTENRVRLRMGVYSCVDKTIDIDRRFDRAKMAADTVKGSFTQNIGFYDEELHEKQLFAERLIEEFPAAIAERQFGVYYQPKFDVRPDVPVLISAEALVRWVHPELGMINPGAFIPLFEDNGLIQRLDEYVWKETARQIREWKDKLTYSIPVSVNVSRVDMYDPMLAETLLSVVGGEGLAASDLLLEVTESAYTQDSAQIIESVEKLRGLGFEIEMDDFGTGYSSLNMISNLPIDALKLDMQFIRNAFAEGGNTHMLEVIIGISDYLSVPVIAEGVETEEQLHALKALGCDIVQGYFFSRPVPASEFEPFILQKKEADIAVASNAEQKQAAEPSASVPLPSAEVIDAATKSKLDLLRGSKEAPKKELNVLSHASETTHDEVAENASAAEGASHEKVHTGIQLRTASIFFVILALIAAAALIISDIAVTRGYQRMVEASDRYVSAQLAASNMESGSDYLTDRVRCFVVTGDVSYLKDFFEEVEVTKRRDKAVEDLERLLGGTERTALDSLNTALSLSNELIDFENHAIRLMIEAGDYSPADVPDEIMSLELSPEDKALSKEQLKERAQTLVFDNNYMHYKDRIRENVAQCTQALIRSSSQELDQSSSQLALLVNIQTAISIVFLLIVLAMVAMVTQLVRKPLSRMVHKMQLQEFVEPTGVEELRFVTRTYNTILKENEEVRERLSHEASHDALTGLFNRGAYDLLMESADTEHMALILVDIDHFKSINDTYGHAIGDRVLKRVAAILRSNFRSVDIICRIGGDEFAIIMTRVNSSLQQLVLNKINRMNETLQRPKDDLPPISLSVGVAFSDRENPQGDIFRDADTALYRVKEAGRNGCAIYE